MEIKIGDYIKFDEGRIGRVIRIDELVYDEENSYVTDLLNDNEEEIIAFESEISKSSENLIDLIQAGDIVNGKKVIDTLNGFEEGILKIVLIDAQSIFREHPEEIETILSKERYMIESYKMK